MFKCTNRSLTTPFLRTYDGVKRRVKKGFCDSKALAKSSALSFSSSLADPLTPLAGKCQMDALVFIVNSVQVFIRHIGY